MKRIFLFYIMAIMAISMSAQNDVTTFLGIPVDTPVRDKIAISYM